MSDYKFFQVDIGEGLATVTMNRPPLNILHNPMMEEFNRLLESVVADESHAAVVIRAVGKAFSAGVDVGDHAADKVREMIRLFHGIFRKLASTDSLTIAAVQGAALGGGCELACFCDIVLASDKAKFGQPEVQVGVFPPVAACALPPLIGIKKAIELTTLGTTIDAAEAWRLGLVNHVFAAEEFDMRVNGFLAGIKKLSRPVVRLAKKATTMMAREQMLSHLERAESLYLNELMNLADAHEGIAAFVAKRAPQWRHG